MRRTKILNSFHILRESKYKDILHKVEDKLYGMKVFHQNKKNPNSYDSISKFITDSIRKKNTTKLVNENLWNCRIAILETWIKEKGYTFVSKSNSENSFDEYDKVININSKLSPETKCYYLLHECGHLLVRVGKNYHQKYPFDKYDRFGSYLIDEERLDLARREYRLRLIDDMLYEEGIKKTKNRPTIKKSLPKRKPYLQTKEYCFILLKEEMDAWKKGTELANRLGVRVNEDKYFKLQVKCLYSYMDWGLTARTPV